MSSLNRTVPGEHRPILRSVLVVLAAIAGAVSVAALDIADALALEDASPPGPGPSPAPGPDAPPPPVEVATNGIPESLIAQAIAATQTQLLLGNPGEPGAGLFIGNETALRSNVIDVLRAHGIKVIGYAVPTVPEPAFPPSFGYVAQMLAEAYEAYSGDTQGHFTGAQAQAFYDALLAGAGA